MFEIIKKKGATCTLCSAPCQLKIITDAAGRRNRKKKNRRRNNELGKMSSEHAVFCLFLGCFCVGFLLLFACLFFVVVV